MTVDIRKIAEQLILNLWSESDKMKERAAGVRMLLQAIVQESEKQANEQNTQPTSKEESTEQAK